MNENNKDGFYYWYSVTHQWQTKDCQRLESSHVKGIKYQDEIVGEILAVFPKELSERLIRLAVARGFR